MYSRKGRDGDGAGAGTSAPALEPGKRTLTEGLGAGRGERKSAKPKPKREDAARAAEGAEAEAEAEAGAKPEGEQAETEAEAADSGRGRGAGDEGEGAGAGEQDGEGSGFGFDELGMDMIEGAVSGALGAMGVPAVTHKTQDKAPSGANDRTKVGVGELVTFSSNMPGKWKASKIGGGFPKTSTASDQFVWVAMPTKGDAKITFDAGKKGQKPVEITMQVVEPTVDYLNMRPLAFPGQGAGAAGVQMTTDVTYLPLDVSFANTMWWEKPGPATAATGYFADHVNVRGKTLPYHRPAAADIEIDAMNSGITDDAGWWDFNGPFSAGSFEWVIPTYYKVEDDGGRHKITDVHQKCTIAADGTMTVTKGSSSHSRTP